MAAHQRTIDAQFRRLPVRSRQVVRRRVAGESLRQIGAHYGLSVGTVQQLIKRAMVRCWKAITHQPRYHVTGHGGQGSAGGVKHGER